MEYVDNVHDHSWVDEDAPRSNPTVARRHRFQAPLVVEQKRRWDPVQERQVYVAAPAL